MRTVGTDRSHVFMLDHHLQRLTSSAQSLLQSAGARRQCASVEDVSKFVLPLMAGCAHRFAQREKSLGREAFGSNKQLRLTVLLVDKFVGDDGVVDTYVHCERLPSPSAPPIELLAVATQRENATAKDARWGIKAAELLKGNSRAASGGMRSHSFEDLLLCGAALGELLEGGSSNFFTISSEGTVSTAERGISLIISSISISSLSLLLVRWCA